MNKIRSLLLALSVLSLCDVTAQTPMYAHSSYDTGGAPGSVIYSNIPPRQPFILQAFYYPSDFPMRPSGRISSFFFRTGPVAAPQDSVIFYGFTFGAKATLDSIIILDSNGYGPFNKAVDTFESDGSQYKTGGMNTTGKWHKLDFHLPYLYYYDNTRNFLIDILFDSASSSFSWMASPSPKGKMLVGQRIWNKGISGTTLLDIGFNVASADIAGFNTIKSFGLFPNPSTDGHFTISFEGTVPSKNIDIAITDAAGSLVYRRIHTNAGTSFLQEINLGEAAKGVYFLKVIAAGETVVRRVILQ